MLAARKHTRKARPGVVFTVVALAAALAATLGLAACQKDQTPRVTLTVVCTDEVRAHLANPAVTDAQTFLQAAADQFAATYDGVDLTIKVVSVPAGTLATTIAPELQPVVVPESEPEPEPEPGEEGEGMGLVPSEPDPTSSLESELSGPKETSDEEAEQIGAPNAIASMKAAFAEEISGGASAPAETVVPDVVFGHYDEIAPAIYTGRITPVGDVITSEMRLNIPDAFLEAGRIPADGRIYLLPFSATQMVLVFDEDLFEACGLDAFVVRQGTIAAPGEQEASAGGSADAVVADAMSRVVVQTWSPAQWVEVLEVLSAKLPTLAQERQVQAFNEWSSNVELARQAAKDAGGDAAAQDAAAAEFGEAPHLSPLYPMMMFGKGSEGARFMVAFLHMFGGSFFDDEGYVLTETPEGIAAASWIALGSAHGYFPPDVEGMTYADCAKLFANGQLGIFAVDSRDIEQLFRDAVVQDEGGEASMSRHYGFVTFPLWSMAAQEPIREFMAAEKPSMSIITEADGTTSGFSALIPGEFTGFAVVDNGDALKVQIAKEFLAFILNSDEWLAYSVVEGEMPADRFMVDKFTKELGVVGEFRYLRDHTVNLSLNVPSWDGVLEAFQQAMGGIVSGGKTAVEATAAIDGATNAVLEPIYRDIKLHE